MLRLKQRFLTQLLCICLLFSTAGQNIPVSAAEPQPQAEEDGSYFLLMHDTDAEIDCATINTNFDPVKDAAWFAAMKSEKIRQLKDVGSMTYTVNIPDKFDGAFYELRAVTALYTGSNYGSPYKLYVNDEYIDFSVAGNITKEANVKGNDLVRYRYCDVQLHKGANTIRFVVDTPIASGSLAGRYMYQMDYVELTRTGTTAPSPTPTAPPEETDSPTPTPTESTEPTPPPVESDTILLLNDVDAAITGNMFNLPGASYSAKSTTLHQLKDATQRGNAYGAYSYTVNVAERGVYELEAVVADYRGTSYGCKHRVEVNGKLIDFSVPGNITQIAQVSGGMLVKYKYCNITLEKGENEICFIIDEKITAGSLAGRLQWQMDYVQLTRTDESPAPADPTQAPLPTATPPSSTAAGAYYKLCNDSNDAKAMEVTANKVTVTRAYANYTDSTYILDYTDNNAISITYHVNVPKSGIYEFYASTPTIGGNDTYTPYGIEVNDVPLALDSTTVKEVFLSDKFIKYQYPNITLSEGNNTITFTVDAPDDGSARFMMDYAELILTDEDPEPTPTPIEGEYYILYNDTDAVIEGNVFKLTNWTDVTKSKVINQIKDSPGAMTYTVNIPDEFDGYLYEFYAVTSVYNGCTYTSPYKLYINGQYIDFDIPKNITKVKDVLVTNLVGYQYYNTVLHKGENTFRFVVDEKNFTTPNPRYMWQMDYMELKCTYKYPQAISTPEPKNLYYTVGTSYKIPNTEASIAPAADITVFQKDLAAGGKWATLYSDTLRQVSAAEAASITFTADVAEAGTYRFYAATSAIDDAAYSPYGIRVNAQDLGVMDFEQAQEATPLIGFGGDLTLYRYTDLLLEQGANTITLYADTPNIIDNRVKFHVDYIELQNQVPTARGFAVDAVTVSETPAADTPFTVSAVLQSRLPFAKRAEVIIGLYQGNILVDVATADVLVQAGKTAATQASFTLKDVSNLTCRVLVLNDLSNIRPIGTPNTTTIGG